MREGRLGACVLTAVVLGGVGVLLGSASAAEAQTNPFTVDLGVHSPTGETGRSFDVVSGQGDWAFHITAVTGNVNTLLLSIRDSSPGDFCWYWSVKRPRAGTLVTAEGMPAATLDACPGTQFEDVNGDALVFHAGFQGAKRAGVTIEVFYPQP